MIESVLNQSRFIRNECLYGFECDGAGLCAELCAARADFRLKLLYFVFESLKLYGVEGGILFIRPTERPGSQTRERRAIRPP